MQLLILVPVSFFLFHDITYIISEVILMIRTEQITPKKQQQDLNLPNETVF